MTTIDHPSMLLPAGIAAQLSAFANEAERLHDLHPIQLDHLYQQKWFRMFIPKSLGGLGLSLPEVVRLEESLAWADGSTAWVATLCAGAGWFVGFVHPEVAREFFTGENVCIAGSGSATGKAEAVTDGYQINGSWPYASGALHATAFTANCVICKDGRNVQAPDGTDLVLPFVLKPSEVVVKKTWNATGMVATASHSFTVKNVTVARERCFEINASAAKLNDPVYRYPFLQLAETTLVANISGLTIRFLELAVGGVSYDDSSTNEEDTRRALGLSLTEKVNDLRRLLFAALDDSWSQLIERNAIEAIRLQQVSQTTYALAKACRQAVDSIYPLCAGRSRSAEGELNRIWRNINTALSHALFRKRFGVESN
jgi:hypothetical protein